MDYSCPCAVDEVNLTLTASIQGRTIKWDFARYPRRGLSRQVLHFVAAIIESAKQFDTFATFLQFRLCIGSILTNINEHDPSGRVQSIRDIDRKFLDAIDLPNLGVAQWIRLGALVRMLRMIREFDSESTAPDLLDGRLGDRLTFVSRHPKPTTTPRDAYSPFVAQQIQQAAKTEIAAVTARVRPGIAHLSTLAAQADVAPHEQRFTPAEKALLELSRSGRITGPDFARYLKEAGLSASRPVEMAEYGHALVETAAQRLVDGCDQRAIESELGLASGTIRRLLCSSREFIALVEQMEDAYLQGIINALRHSVSTAGPVLPNPDDAEPASGERDLPASAAAATRHASDLAEQLARRLEVLGNWISMGVPLHKLGTINFSLTSVERWRDRDYGITPIRRLTSGGRLPSLHAQSVADIRLLLHILSERHGANFYKGYMAKVTKKIGVLERWVVEGMPDSKVAGIRFNRDSFVRWTDTELGLEPLRFAHSVTTHPRYGPLMVRANQLLNALQIQCRQRGLLPRRTPNLDRGVERPQVLGLTICPSQDELTSFMAHLGLMCQVDYGSLKNLTRDCLQSAANGYVDVVYRKARSGNRQRSERVRDGGIDSPGGVIRLVLELTEPAHQALRRAGRPDANYLWLAFFQPNQFKRCRFQHPIRHPWWKFCKRHRVLDDDQETRLDTIHPSRFRKTVKESRYRRAGGDIYAIADDNSYAVARDNYANLPSLAELHDETVANGLRRAVSDLTARVIAQDSDPPAQARRLRFTWRWNGFPSSRA